MMNLLAGAIMNNELIELAKEIINDANRYYEIDNPDEQTPVILENIVLSASRMLKILTNRKHGCENCTCPTLDGYKITGSSCPIHELPICDSPF